MSVALTRRGLLAGCSAMVALAPLRLSLAQAATGRRLIVLILRGGMDGLAAVPPFADPSYRSARGALAIPAPGEPEGMIDLDGAFGLHPALAPLDRWYHRGELLPVHAIATGYRERSHFDAQTLLETAAATPGREDDGWLNRALAVMAAPADRRLALAFGPTVPLVLRGTMPVGSWAPSRLPDPDPDFLERVAALLAGDPALAAALDRAVMMNPPDITAPGGQRAQLLALADAAADLLVRPDGPRIATLDVPGWDTHARQGAARGRLATQFDSLAAVHERLRAGLAPVWSETLVLSVTEFGRTVAVNGTGGTDHGTGGVALLAGGAVDGGRVLADWPGLAPNRLWQGRDLAPTLAMESLLAAVLAEHLGLPRGEIAAHVLPQAEPGRLGGIVRL